MRSHPTFLELRELWRLALPLALVHAGSEVMRTVDTAFVGRLGAAPLGALGLGNALFFAISIFGIGIMMGLDPLISQAIGAGDRARARQLLWQSVWLAILAGGVLTIVLIAAIPLFRLAGIEPVVAELAAPFMAVRVVGLVPLLLFIGMRSYLQATGLTWPMVLAMIVSNVVNLGLAFLLVFGGADLPAWTGPLRSVPTLGVIGAAVATSAATIVQVAVAAAAVRAVGGGGPFPGSRRPAWPDLRKASRVGVPIGFQLGAEVGVFALVAFLAGRLGAEALAAHQIALTLASFTFTVIIGIGAAGSVRVGRAVGARDAVGARRAGIVALVSGATFMSSSALVFFIFPETLARVLTDQPGVVAVAIPLVAVAAVFQISDGLQGVGAGVLRGAGDTLFPLVANLSGHYLIGLPVGVVLAFFGGFGVLGLWWGLFAGLSTVALSLVARFLGLTARPIARLEQGDAGGDIERSPGTDGR